MTDCMLDIDITVQTEQKHDVISNSISTSDTMIAGFTKQSDKRLNATSDAANNTVCWLETDLEPDDVQAMYILHQRGYKFHTIVVGEGDTKIKVQRIHKYMQLLGQKDYTVIEGMASDKKFKYDGKEFEGSSNDDDVDILTDSLHYRDYYKPQLVTYIKEVENPVMICLKPLRELIEVQDQCKDLFQSIRLFLYGSFNFRCLYKRYGVKQACQNIVNLLSCFKQVCIYESFLAIGPINSINYKTMPKLYAAIKAYADHNEYLAVWKKLLLEFWNEDLIESCKSTIDKISTSTMDSRTRTKLARSKKTLDDLTTYREFQTVLADNALCCILDHPKFLDRLKQVILSFDEDGYTTGVAPSLEHTIINSNTYLYKGLTIEELENLMLEYMF
jgi:hypothetical protein